MISWTIVNGPKSGEVVRDDESGIMVLTDKESMF